jgi:hypothetical protein
MGRMGEKRKRGSPFFSYALLPPILPLLPVLPSFFPLMYKIWLFSLRSLLPCQVTYAPYAKSIKMDLPCLDLLYVQITASTPLNNEGNRQ